VRRMPSNSSAAIAAFEDAVICDLRARGGDRVTAVDLVECESLTLPGTDIVAVVVARVDGADVEPLLITRSDADELRIEADVELPRGINLRLTFGGLEFASLSEATRACVTERILEELS